MEEAHWKKQKDALLSDLDAMRNLKLIDNLKKSSIDKIKGVIMISSLWDGFGSALTPTLISQFNESNTNTIVFGIMPSQVHLY